MRKLQVRELAYLPLGRQGENNAQRIVWHGIADSWARLYGEGVFALTVKRQNDSAPYPASITSENGDVVWAISAADTAQAGEGMAELTYTVGGVIAKSRTWRTVVERSLSADGTTDPPEPQKSWVDEVLAAGAEAKTAAASAEEDAEAAGKAAAAAAGSAEAAGKSAQSALRYADSAGTLANDAASSAAAARNAASSASGSAASAGSSAGSANGAASRAASSEANAKTSETNAKASADAAAEALTKAPYVGDNGNWWVWNATESTYQDTGIAATGPQGATGLQGATGATGPQGETGAPGTKWVVSNYQPDTSTLNDGDLWLLTSRHGQYYPGDVLKYVSSSGNSQWPWVWVASIQGLPGETGAQGPQGATGATGPAGADGADGETPYIGDNGNWYIGDTDTGIVAEGADGATWFTGLDYPADAKIGDLWLYTSTSAHPDGFVLGDVAKYDGTKWTVLTNIRGAQGAKGDAGADGADGAKWFAQDSEPQTGVNAGDYWLDSGTGLVYRATNSSGDTPVLWKATGANLTGPRGATGADGKTPVKGTDYFTTADVNEIAQAAAEKVDLSGKQDKITASGILKGTASGIVAAEEGVDYLKTAPVTSVNGQTGAVETTFEIPLTVTSIGNKNFGVESTATYAQIVAALRAKKTITARVADWGDDGGVIFTQVSCPPDDFSDEDAFTLNFEAKPSETADTFLRIFVDPDAPTIGDGYDIKLNFGSLAYKSKVSKTDLADDVPPKALTVTLAASGWADNQITVAAEGVTASSLVDVSPAPSSVTDPAANNLYAYAAAMIQCVAQGSGTLTFMCQTTPTIDLVANIVILR